MKFNKEAIALRAINKGATAGNGNNYFYVPVILAKIHRLAVTYNRIQEMWCNVEMDDKTTKYWENREQQLESKMKFYAADINCKMQFEGDPRGMTVRLICPEYRNEDDYIGIA